MTSKHLRGLVALLFVLCILTGCEDNKFRVGQSVFVRANGDKVVVLMSRHFPMQYRCRTYGSQQRRRDGVFSADTEITRYAKVWFYEHELVKSMP